MEHATPQAVPPRWRWKRYALVLAWGAGFSLLNLLRHQSLADAAIGTLLSVVALAVVLGIVATVEHRLSGRARLWGRIAEVSAAIGIVPLVIALNGAGTAALIMALGFWGVVTGGMVILAKAQPDVST